MVTRGGAGCAMVVAVAPSTPIGWPVARWPSGRTRLRRDHGQAPMRSLLARLVRHQKTRPTDQPEGTCGRSLGGSGLVPGGAGIIAVVGHVGAGVGLGD